MLLIAIAILIIALANYINLVTAKKGERIAEIGVRKVIGANRQSLIAQFLIEALLINSLAILLAGIFIYAGQNGIHMVVGQPLEPLLSWIELLYIVPVTLIVSTVLAGLYPAFFLSNLTPSRALVRRKSPIQRELLRKSLVVFQYSISFLLIVGTIIVYSQLNYMRKQDLGFFTGSKASAKSSNDY